MKEIEEHLESAFHWYQGMVSPTTGRLVYQYDPLTRTAISDGSPIRDIASIFDVARLGAFLGRSELVPVVERSVTHYADFAVRRDRYWVVDQRRLHEPSNIAHSAFLILALLESAHPSSEALVLGLAEGILHQQRADGSFEIHFGDERDQGVEFYPAEAMLALLEAYRFHPRHEFLEAVERGFAWSERFYAGTPLDPDMLVFFANWESRAGAKLVEMTKDRSLALRATELILRMHDRIVSEGFYDDIAQNPERQSTVQVACAMEGLNEAFALARNRGDARRLQRYSRCSRTAASFLFRAQRMEGFDPPERGGFGSSLIGRVQRIDVTGHAACALIGAARNGLFVEPEEHAQPNPETTA